MQSEESIRRRRDAVYHRVSGRNHHIYFSVSAADASVYIFILQAGREARKKTLTGALGFVAGFTTVFVAMGAMAGTVGSFLREYQTAVNIVCGLVVIFFRLNFMGVFKLNLFKGSSRSVNTENMGFFSAFCLGWCFPWDGRPVWALFWFRADAGFPAGAWGEGMLMLFTYSLGLGIPFILSAVLIDYLKSAF